MSESFDSAYAEAYDLFYQDKDYVSECDLIERLFRAYSDGPVGKVLDLGCGTGSHALVLAGRGYEVAGVDRSESMLAHARRKTADPSNGGRAVFYQGDVRAVNLNERFDAVLMMFAVLGYQLENADVLSALGTVRRHLRPGGLFIFDVWYGPAVLYLRPSDRTKVISTAEGQIVRVASGDLDVGRHLCEVHFHVSRMAGNEVTAEAGEDHPVRYFFPLELKLFLESSGLDLIRLRAFPEFERQPDEETWNVLGIARAV